MIEIEQINRLKGASKYGSCTVCGKFSSEDSGMKRISFVNDETNQGSSVCLCSKCYRLLFEAMQCRFD
jgi:hypothetical protein